ncbi:MAG: hypothetical protein R2838_14925 [Caldilineaceae bacterium]
MGLRRAAQRSFPAAMRRITARTTIRCRRAGTLDYAVAGMAHGGGFGLGGEVGAPPSPSPMPSPPSRKPGLLSVPHAGETVGGGQRVGRGRGIWAQRIGHGVRAIEDPALLTLLKEQAIPLE